MNGNNLDWMNTTGPASSRRDETTQLPESTGDSSVGMSGPLFRARISAVAITSSGARHRRYGCRLRSHGPRTWGSSRVEGCADRRRHRPRNDADLERRFKRELLLARQVTHKNVVRIHDLGEIDGIKYITMPYLKGADLSSVLGESGKLSVPVALRIARQIVSGLRAAHDAGVIHRDLKPANIMIDTESNAIIMDFGIAQSNATKANETAPARVAGGFDPWATGFGAVMGTLRYMAPEQARGEAVDHRADIYAFGLILRDMLLGGRSDGDQSAYEELSQRIEDGLPPARSIDAAIPEALDEVISRCLCIDAASRYQTSAELAADVERLDEQGMPFPMLRRAISWASPASGAPAAEREPVSVLIADFDNRSGDSVFEGALEHALTLALEQGRYISVFKSKDARAIAAELSSDKSNRVTEEIGELIARREALKVLVAGSISVAPEGYRVDLKAIEPATRRAIAVLNREVAEKAGAERRRVARRARAGNAQRIGDRDVRSRSGGDRQRCVARGDGGVCPCQRADDGAQDSGGAGRISARRCARAVVRSRVRRDGRDLFELFQGDGQGGHQL